MEFLSKSEKETAEIARNFASNLKPGGEGATIVGLYGELGSGKTTFMKYFARSLGVGEKIQSPTFVIMKMYGGRGLGGEVLKLIHVDAYRIEKEEEMKVLAWDEIVKDPKNLICVEWPEKISGIMPEHAKIFFEHVSENERKIKIENEKR